jgi:hypothetical protein
MVRFVVYELGAASVLMSGSYILKPRRGYFVVGRAPTSRVRLEGARDLPLGLL